jgi:hypothetical protein
MANIISRNYIQRVLLSTVLLSFTVSILPLPANQYSKTVTLNEAVFMVRLEKLVEKLVKSKEKNKDVNSIVGYLVDIKNEIEVSCNIKLD